MLIMKRLMASHPDEKPEDLGIDLKTKNVGSRFFKVTERLLSGRICIAALCLGGTRGALYVAIKYAQ